MNNVVVALIVIIFPTTVGSRGIYTYLHRLVYHVGLAAIVHQRQLSVPSLRGRLMSASASWGVNGHTTRCISTQFWLVSG